MTNANMQLVVLAVDLEDKMINAEPKLDPGEHIVAKVVELTNLNAELKGNCTYLRFNYTLISHFSPIQDYDRKVDLVIVFLPFQLLIIYYQGFVIDARLSHLASGMELAQQLGIM